ncbi:helix-turn-helix transcriptional regulator [Streptomyces sp. NPDC057654]|uniref:helix-turn-helix transcriptional regulator n=1 Tax=Streptomyces sp. NPDC057654 TaxID=3346196 RepID=UPI00369445AA
MGLAGHRKALGYSQEGLAHALGVDRTTVGRWERGETEPQPPLRPELAELLQLDLAELNALLPQPQAVSSESAGAPPRDHDDSGDLDDMIRREFLRLIAVTGAALALPDDETAALVDGAQRGSSTDFLRINGHLWQVYQLARSKRSVAPVVRDHLATLKDRLKGCRGAEVSELSGAAGDLFQLAGELAFDRNHYSDAAASYNVAASASHGAGAFDLWACALVRQSYIDLYDHRYEDAADVLAAASRVARRGDTQLATRYWVAAVEAEAYAGLKDLSSCERAMDEAEKVLDLSPSGQNGGWIRFDGSRLAEERGARYVQLGRLDLAEQTLMKALGQQALAQGQSYRRRGAVLTDLAAVGARRRDSEQVLSYAGEALELARASSSGYVTRRLHFLQAEFEPLSRDRRIVELGAEISALRTT